MAKQKKLKLPKDFKLRKTFNVKNKVSEFSEYIGCNPKGIYYIEDTLLASKPVRYFMFLKRNGHNVNKILDELIKEEDNLLNK